MDLLDLKALERENDQLFSEIRRIQIDQMIKKSNFQDAFILLVTSLDRLNKNKVEKNNLIIYYHDFIRDFIFNNLEYKL